MQMDFNQTLLEKTLHENFGFSEFRSGQLAALTQIFSENRLLCIQPTGHGKSLLYQLPSVILDGITLVISPLLALMRDQLQQLNHRFNIPAASINTDQTHFHNLQARQDAKNGRIKILFISPEQLEHIDKFNFITELPINLLVIDEAHCISTWGHDFRPSYRQIILVLKELLKKNSNLKILALTATANQTIERDIIQQLSLNSLHFAIHRESMNRPNIRLSVIKLQGLANKLIILRQLLTALPQSGLIYCATRENTQIVSDYLNSHGYEASAYHAGLDIETKHRIQEAFRMNANFIIAATNALGMGIDKQNLRFVIHFDFPGSITAYYQEVGRAGRDGLPAEGILLYDPADTKIQEYFIESALPSLNDFKHVLDCLGLQRTPPNLATLKRITGLHPTRLNVIVAELIEQKFIEKSLVNGLMTYRKLHSSSNLNLSRYLNQLNAKKAELAAIQRYAEKEEGCLMVTLRRFLGDKETEPCLQCSTCKPLFFSPIASPDQILTTTSWLNHRTVPITLDRKIRRVAPGIAVLDGKLRSEDFLLFMRERKNKVLPSKPFLYQIKLCLDELMKHYQFKTLVSLPSRTWESRTAIIEILGNYLKIPIFPNLLYWQEIPSARQGELLNNDQRQHNVSSRMKCEKPPSFLDGPILLFDDYTGSGATLNEAARCLREEGKIKNEIIPFTLAAVKWRIGKAGMI